MLAPNQFLSKTPCDTLPSHVHLLFELYFRNKLQLLKNRELLFNHPVYVYVLFYIYRVFGFNLTVL